MDRLDIAALEERVQRLFASHAKEISGEFEEYNEVLDILWEEEFMVTTMRILELAGKIPFKSVRIAFLRGIIIGIVQPLGFYDTAGLLHTVLEQISLQSRPRIIALPFGYNLPRPDDRRKPPGVR